MMRRVVNQQRKENRWVRCRERDWYQLDRATWEAGSRDKTRMIAEQGRREMKRECSEEVGQRWGYGGCEDFVGKWEELKFDAFSNFEPVERAQDGSDVTGFRSCNKSTCKRVLNLLESGYLRLRERVITLITLTLIKFKVNNWGVSGIGSWRTW